MKREELQEQMQAITNSIAETRKLQQDENSEIEKEKYKALSEAKADYLVRVETINHLFGEKRRVNNEHWRNERVLLDNQRIEMINKYRKKHGGCPYLQKSDGLAVKVKGGE